MKNTVHFSLESRLPIFPPLKFQIELFRRGARSIFKNHDTILPLEVRKIVRDFIIIESSDDILWKKDLNERQQRKVW